jgi:hypothetical protein
MTKRMKRLMQLAGISIVGVTAVVAGVFFTHSNAATHLVNGGSPAGQALASRILAAFPHDGLTGVDFASPPAGLLGHPAADDSWLDLTIAKDENLSDAVWRANLLASTFQTEATQSGADSLEGYSIRVEGSTNKSSVGDFVKMIPPSSALNRQDIPSIGAAEAAVTKRLHAGAVAADVQFRGVRFFTTPELAFEVTIAVRDPAEFVKTSPGRLYKLLGEDSGYDAREIRVTDQHGSLFMLAAFNTDLSSGATWIRPDLHPHGLGGTLGAATLSHG